MTPNELIMKTTTPTTLSNADALALLKAELLAIPVARLRPINLDIPTLVLAVTGALPGVLALRPTIASVLGEVQAQRSDKLPVAVQAVSQAHADYLIALQPMNVQLLSNEVVEVREILAADALTQVRRKLIGAGELAELRGNVGFANQIYDVFQLVSLYRKRWPALEKHTGVTLDELARADALAQRFTEALAAREKGASLAGEFGDLRVRAYTWLLDVHDEVRRAVSYLRWHEGDVDTIIPSLWANRSRHPASGELKQDQPLPAAPTPLITAPVVVAPVPATPVVVEPAAPPIAPGLPGASPFIQ